MLFKLVERFVSTLDTWTKLIANFRDAASDRADMLNATQNPVNSISMLELRV